MLIKERKSFKTEAPKIKFDTYLLSLADSIFKSFPEHLLKLFFLNLSEQNILQSKTFFKFNPFLYFYYFEIVKSKHRIFPKLLLRNTNIVHSFFDLRAFLSRKFFISRHVLSPDHFLKVAKKSVLPYNKFFLKVDFSTFFAVKSYIEYFRAFKFNEYLFNFVDSTRRPLNLKIKAKLLGLRFFADIWRVRTLVFFRYFNFYRIYFTYNKKKYLPHLDAIIYLTMNVIFFKFYCIFFYIKRFQFYFISLFSKHVIPYVLIAAYKMTIETRKLLPAGDPGFADFFDSLKRLKEHVRFEPYSLNSVFFDYFKNYYYSLFSNDKTISNFYFLGKFLDYEFASKDLLIIDPRNIFFYNVICLVLVYYTHFNFIHDFNKIDSKGLVGFVHYFLELFKLGFIKLVTFVPRYNTLDDYFHMKSTLDKLLLDVFNYNVYNLDWPYLDLRFTFVIEKMQLDKLSYRRELNLYDLFRFFFQITGPKALNSISQRDRVLLLFCYLLQLVRDFAAYLLFFSLNNLSENLLVDHQRVLFRIVQFKLSRYNSLYKFTKFWWKHSWNYFNAK